MDTTPIALLVESQAEPLDNLPAHRQTLIFGYNGEVRFYDRTSNGSKGRGQVWTRVPADRLWTLSDSPIINTPVAVAITERDLALVGLDQVTNIAVKALYANESAEPTTAQTPHREAVILLATSLMNGDQALCDYVIDKRTATGKADITIAPLTTYNSAPIANPIKAEVLDIPITPKYEQVEAVALDNLANANFSLNMITVPDPKWGREYINRRFDGVTEWEIFDEAMKDNTNILIEGQAGSGKTMAVQGYASARGLRYFNVSNNNGIDPSQLFGRWIPNPNPSNGQQYIWQDGAVTLLFRHGGVLLLNEVNFLPARVSTVLFSALDYRREIQLLENGGEVIKAHPNLLIVADMNSGYKGTQELNQAFSDRFGIKLEFPYDRSIENKIIKSKALLVLADQLRAQYDNEQISTPISTRSLVAFLNNANKFGVNFAITSFVNGFRKEERGGVRLACETHKDNIAEELGQAVSMSMDTDSRVESFNG
jgi:hypothetical protein